MLLSLTGQKHTFFEKKDVQDLLWSEPSSLVRLISHGSACSWVVDSWHIGRYRQKCHHASNFLIQFPLPRRAAYSTPASNFALFFSVQLKHHLLSGPATASPSPQETHATHPCCHWGLQWLPLHLSYRIKVSNGFVCLLKEAGRGLFTAGTLSYPLSSQNIQPDIE